MSWPKLHMAGSFPGPVWAEREPAGSGRLHRASRSPELAGGCGAAAADVARVTIIGRKTLAPSFRERDRSQELRCDQRSGSHRPGKRLLVSILKKEQGTGVRCFLKSCSLLLSSTLVIPSQREGYAPLPIWLRRYQKHQSHTEREGTKSSGFPRL